MQESRTGQAVRVPIAEDGIAWSSDVKKKFAARNVTNFNVDPDNRGGGTIVGAGSAHAAIVLVGLPCVTRKLV